MDHWAFGLSALIGPCGNEVVSRKKIRAGLTYMNADFPEEPANNPLQRTVMNELQKHKGQGAAAELGR